MSAGGTTPGLSIAEIMASIGREVGAPATPRIGPDVAAGIATPLSDLDERTATVDLTPIGDVHAIPGVPTTPPDAAPGPCPPSLEDTVRDLLRPLLRDWLDAHLPEIVEAATHAEIRRLTGQSG